MFVKFGGRRLFDLGMCGFGASIMRHSVIGLSQSEGPDGKRVAVWNVSTPLGSSSRLGRNRSGESGTSVCWKREGEGEAGSRYELLDAARWKDVGRLRQSWAGVRWLFSLQLLARSLSFVSFVWTGY